MSAICGSSASGSIDPFSGMRLTRLRDVLGIIRDALDHACDLQRGDDAAQIVRHRRAERDQLDGAAFGLGFEEVEF